MVPSKDGPNLDLGTNRCLRFWFLCLCFQREGQLCNRLTSKKLVPAIYRCTSSCLQRPWNHSLHHIRSSPQLSNSMGRRNKSRIQFDLTFYLLLLMLVVAQAGLALSNGEWCGGGRRQVEREARRILYSPACLAHCPTANNKTGT